MSARAGAITVPSSSLLLSSICLGGASSSISSSHSEKNKIKKVSMIPITVFTGFLGAGKTTLILSLLPALPKNYRSCLLKNEFGDIEGA